MAASRPIGHPTHAPRSIRRDNRSVAAQSWACAAPCRTPKEHSMRFVSSRRDASTARRAFIVAAVTVAASVIVPVNAASAQLGGLVKKARDKVVENQVE